MLGALIWCLDNDMFSNLVHIGDIRYSSGNIAALLSRVTLARSIMCYAYQIALDACGGSVGRGIAKAPSILETWPVT